MDRKNKKFCPLSYIEHITTSNKIHSTMQYNILYVTLKIHSYIINKNGPNFFSLKNKKKIGETPKF